MQKSEISAKIIAQIKEKSDKNFKLVDDIAELLDISNNAAYRRLNGAIDLTLDEADKLCEKFNISLGTSFCNTRKKACFDYFSLFGENYAQSYATYLSALEGALKNTLAKNGTLWVAASDIPFGFVMRYPMLMAFKSFCWEKEMTQANTSFSLQHIAHKAQFFAFDTLYSKINSTELWTTHTFSGFIELIDFYKQLALVGNEELEILKKDLKDLLFEAETLAANGQKSNGGQFNLYIAPLNLPNTIFLHHVSEEEQISFLKMYSINSIWTSNPLYCREQKQWFESMITSSTLVSKNNPKERRAFFGELHKRVERL